MTTLKPPITLMISLSVRINHLERGDYIEAVCCKRNGLGRRVSITSKGVTTLKPLLSARLLPCRRINHLERGDYIEAVWRL
ncbi:unknown protein [Desulfotalea psychrophila LSv54]|uniref:Uncharacterized protein n=1 Tax=Desulfotalea psychrophila (strain LSv54 / DSM 12343) TaxID=177439 RepID=Q6ARW3_DESPS|nr:unknown protein [Desulfotalea psychrophila LSv54]